MGQRSRETGKRLDMAKIVNWHTKHQHKQTKVNSGDQIRLGRTRHLIRVITESLKNQHLDSTISPKDVNRLIQLIRMIS